MKKLFIALLIAALAFSFTACGETPNDADEDVSGGDTVTEIPEEPETPDVPESPEGEEPAVEGTDEPVEDPGVYEEELPEDIENFVTSFRLPVPPFYINSTYIGEAKHDLGNVIEICNVYEFTFSTSEAEIRDYCAAVQDAWQDGSFTEAANSFSFDAQLEGVYSLLIVWDSEGKNCYIEGTELLESINEEDESEETPSQTVEVTDFDTSWANNEYEAMLPELPFGGWAEEKVNSAEFYCIKTPDEAIDYGIGSYDRMAMANYLAYLEALNFTVIEIGDTPVNLLGAEVPDKWLVIDTEGRTVEIAFYYSSQTNDGAYRGYCLAEFDKNTFGTVGGVPSQGGDTTQNKGLTTSEVLSFLPTLPFSGWTGGCTGGNVYEYSVVGLNTSGATNPPDSGEPDGLDKDIFLDYLATLPSYGFDVNETGSGYRWTAADAYGNFVTFMIGDGGCFLTVELNTVTTPQQPDINEDEPDNGNTEVVGIDLPELPYGEWTREDLGNGSYVLTGTNVDHWETEEVFISDLYLDGYTVFEIVPNDGQYYEYQAEKNVGKTLYTVTVQGDINNGVVSIIVTVR